MRNNKKLLTIVPIILFLIMGSLFFYQRFVAKENILTKFIDNKTTEEKVDTSGKQTARVVANGDILYHDALYWSARKDDGTYDFDPYFEYVKDRISGADLAIGDFEGTISDKHPLAGYPLFNAPKEAAQSMKNIGYDVVDLAHNHILDSGLYGLKYTVNEFSKLGLDTIGVFADTPRDQAGILIKEVNGIKIALLAYAYGYNGMEANLTAEEYNKHLADLDEGKIKADLERAEKEADVTIVMPQMGEEYRLKPTDEQRELYHKMVSWGADVILGGHPHVVEPSETVEQDGEKKFIIYSMGNFISNQTFEMLNNKWTERGVLMDIVFEKENGKTVIKTVQAHPTLVKAVANGKTYQGYPLFDYRVMVVEDFMPNGKYYGQVEGDLYNKIEATYKEMTELVNVQF